MAATKSKSESRKSKLDVERLRDSVVERASEGLREGYALWQQPWPGNQMPANLISKKPYRGINPALLTMTAIAHGYESPWWVSRKQGYELGGNLKKITPKSEESTGQHGTIVIFNKRLTFTDKNDLDEDNKPKRKQYWLTQYSNVFNLDQFENIPAKKVPKVKEIKPNPDVLKRLDEFVAPMPDKPEVITKGRVAGYDPKSDNIHMPKVEIFDSTELYAYTKAHELGHSTGAEKRLDRTPLALRKDSPRYANEELTAEIFASMVVQAAQIPVSFEPTKNYLGYWLDQIGGDNKLLISAGSRAHAAFDYVTGISYDNGDES